MSVEIRCVGNRLAVAGCMTLETAAKLFAEGLAALPEEPLFDLATVTEVDSSGLAVLFGWMREARSQGKGLRIANMPANLASLAEVYGVTELLPLS